MTYAQYADDDAIVKRDGTNRDDSIVGPHAYLGSTQGIADGDFVEITSRRGKAVAQCRVTETIRAGTCFLPFHWGRRPGFWKSANNLTLSARDPLSLQPELKACAVRLRRGPSTHG